MMVGKMEKTKTIKEAREEAYDELLHKPEYKEIRDLMLQNIMKVAREIIGNYWEKENGVEESNRNTGI